MPWTAVQADSVHRKTFQRGAAPPQQRKRMSKEEWERNQKMKREQDTKNKKVGDADRVWTESEKKSQKDAEARKKEEERDRTTSIVELCFYYKKWKNEELPCHLISNDPGRCTFCPNFVSFKPEAVEKFKGRKGYATWHDVINSGMFKQPHSSYEVQTKVELDLRPKGEIRADDAPPPAERGKVYVFDKRGNIDMFAGDEQSTEQVPEVKCTCQTHPCLGYITVQTWFGEDKEECKCTTHH